MEFSSIHISMWFIFVQLFLFSSNSTSSSGLPGNEVDRLSLLAFKAEIVNDTRGILSSWNESLDFCEWRGITCGRRHRRVTVMDLRSSALEGQLSPNIGNLSFLRTLRLENNSFGHTIPSEIGRLFRLQRIRLHNNSFNGAIPSNISRCSNLQYLLLYGNNLSGKLPTEIASLSKLRVLDLGSINQLRGTLPPSLGHTIFPNIKKFYCHMNQFSGPTPVSVANASNLMRFVILDNKFTGKVPRLAGIPLKSTSGSSLGVSLLKLSYGDLLKATDGFSSANLIGAGSFRSVYKGILDQHEGRVVAVKVLNLQTSRASKSFIAECEALRTVRHRNLVKLLTACSSIDFQGNDFKALVYDFMVNGSLEEWLHNSAQQGDNPTNLQKNLDLIQRVNIAINIASALDYLHNGSDMPIVHCDLKPSNILLDGDMTGCVGDFGLARFLPDASRPFSAQESSSNAIKGTIGYTAPEYGSGTAVSTYGDVYSFGILLLEMLTGKRPTDDMFKDGLDLHNFVLTALPERVKEICDPRLLHTEESGITTATDNRGYLGQDDQRQRADECLISLARIGVACSAAMPRERMDASNVVAELCRTKDVLVGTRMPRERP
ncbi:putative receptor-like protein kinase At3g47110 [Pyrus x bretschneideri]|uniref:putative receptor-like protein kinase At3g47110 n=1 Tax=Pyrus x bretschneideri TaxID=225117 RepID=UPI00202E0A23|nr:putative receptor-like protein kinase At3g47110 [Pyrus x bretschneideri]